jgi:hypothetical protein
MAEVLARQERMKQWKEATSRRQEAKRHVASEVIAGRCGLAEAIGRFRVLDQEWPPSRPQMLMPRGLARPEDEWDGRNVLSVVRLLLANRPGEAAAVAGRLADRRAEALKPSHQ